MIPVWETGFAFLLGLVVGSFCNAVIWRLHVRRSFTRGRSVCPRCKKTLRKRDLIPIVSFIALRGRCAFCRKAISWQYPLVELATSALFAAFVWIEGVTLLAGFHVAMTALLVILFVYDLRYMLVPDSVVLPAAILAFCGQMIAGASLSATLLGGIIGAGFFLLQYLLSKGTWIGGGDIRIGLLMGVLLGWPAVIAALGLAYVSGSLIGLTLIAARRKGWKSQIPFGTFLTASTVVTLLYFHAITEALTSLFTL